mmetsp:Transcript_23081/g.44907  ORF Transcript_23081/g.44907 Transcript_23081/m.44907 type:complete len:272 (-) Transcript_23081:1218-2033(-)
MQQTLRVIVVGVCVDDRLHRTACAAPRIPSDRWASSFEDLPQTHALLVLGHELVHNVKHIARDFLDVVRADAERDALDRREAERLDPRRVTRTAINRTHLVQIQHQIDRTEQVCGLGDDELHGAAEIGTVLRIHIAELELEIRRAHIPDIREVRARVVIQERVLRALVDLKLWHDLCCAFFVLYLPLESLSQSRGSTPPLLLLPDAPSPPPGTAASRSSVCSSGAALLGCRPSASCCAPCPRESATGDEGIRSPQAGSADACCSSPPLSLV